MPQPQKLHVAVRPYMIQQLSAALRDEQQLYYITQHGQPFGGPAAPTTPLDPPLHGIGRLYKTSDY